jgi:hypothetical protein
MPTSIIENMSNSSKLSDLLGKATAANDANKIKIDVILGKARNVLGTTSTVSEPFGLKIPTFEPPLLETNVLINTITTEAPQNISTTKQEAIENLRSKPTNTKIIPAKLDTRLNIDKARGVLRTDGNAVINSNTLENKLFGIPSNLPL